MEAQIRSISNLRSSIKPRPRGWKSLLTHHWFRRLTQSVFLIFILFVSIRHVVVGEGSGIITASAEAYCPFGGLETLYKYITGGGSFVSHTHLSNVVLLVAVLVTALLTRSAFCGWVCPLGFIQDLVNNFSAFITRKTRPKVLFVVVPPILHSR